MDTDMLSLREIEFMLNVEEATIRAWREGSSQRDPLPATIELVEGRKRVFIHRDDLTNYLGFYRPDLLPKMTKVIK